MEAYVTARRKVFLSSDPPAGASPQCQLAAIPWQACEKNVGEIQPPIGWRDLTLNISLFPPRSSSHSWKGQSKVLPPRCLKGLVVRAAPMGPGGKKEQSLCIFSPTPAWHRSRHFLLSHRNHLFCCTPSPSPQVSSISLLGGHLSRHCLTLSASPSPSPPASVADSAPRSTISPTATSIRSHAVPHVVLTDRQSRRWLVHPPPAVDASCCFSSRSSASKHSPGQPLNAFSPPTCRDPGPSLRPSASLHSPHSCSSYVAYFLVATGLSLT